MNIAYNSAPFSMCLSFQDHVLKKGSSVDGIPSTVYRRIPFEFPITVLSFDVVIGNHSSIKQHAYRAGGGLPVGQWVGGL